IHSIAPIESTKEPEHLLSMGYEHPSITPETEFDKVTESNAENLLPIPKYDQSTSTDRPILLNDNEDHPVQNKESPENSFEENVVSETNQEPPQDSDIHQLIKECSVEVPEEQKQKMEDTMFDLRSYSKLLSINSINSQRLYKKEQEVKNVEEQAAERRNRAEKSLQNFRVIHKSSISFKNTSQIS
nr:hypothetical protein [Tanacetum cinerariifolium]